MWMKQSFSIDNERLRKHGQKRKDLPRGIEAVNLDGKRKSPPFMSSTEDTGAERKVQNEMVSEKIL